MTMGETTTTKPTFRVPAGSSRARLGNLTTDAISNFVARLGITNQNLLAFSGYDYTPLSRMSMMLEWAYRGSWIVGAAVDCVADDMTRAGIQPNSDTDPDDIEKLFSTMHDLCFWQRLNETIKWSRLYGGALLAMMIEGQDMAMPLDPETVPQDGLRGFLVLDRWMVQPTFAQLVLDPGPDYGMPVFYDVIANAPFMPRQRIHFSRVMRMDGVVLPFRQRLAENGWGMSVVERIYDRLIAFDSGTLGASQLLFKAYLRTYKVNGYRDLLGAGGELHERFASSMELMRLLQSNEGLTVIDKEDEFETHQYSFAGIPDTLLMIGQQVAGALGIPLVRLFGQAPAGLNSTGESDFRNYDYMIHAAQEARLRRPLTLFFKVLWQSVLGHEPPPGWNFGFNSILVLNEMEKAEIAQRDADTIKLLHDGGIISTKIALQELKQSSILTGRFTNITEEDIEDSEQAPPPWEESQQQPPGGGGGFPPGMPGQQQPGGGQKGGISPPRPAHPEGPMEQQAKEDRE
jgi:phage-related protein (TIGR01555 family)